ncbi:class I SAM-dependent methyltransferase [Tenggerimyces flavus]|uniref:Class I SAM-dependent methyltransferase n=1 Tax=Tenggerimyces flavus TaxID=1708749 RepID=A0ABV7YF61_9ACTN|nr:class I SAM-dependent methyltransferase [Tenggerimyces flavus]MBM7791322.1 SAM-dependent methyltransferase [Tenggerimyces flavus]
MSGIADGARPSPNIWNHPDVYELENRAVDPDGVLEAAMWARRTWDQATVLDIGCGTGFHLPRFAERATKVIGVEPHPDLAQRARQRTAFLTNIEVRDGAAQTLPVEPLSVDVVHARWAYFFGPGSEPGLREIARVVRHGGAAFVIDNDATRSTFGRWFQRAFPKYKPNDVERFWASHGWNREPLTMHWRFDRREDFEAVVNIEFRPKIAKQVIKEHAGTEVDYAVNLWWRRF